MLVNNKRHDRTGEKQYAVKMSIACHVASTELVFRCATEADIPGVFALYRSLVGSPYCAWTADYPSLNHVCSDVACGALYVVQRQTDLVAAGAIAYLDEHDPLQAWSGKHPCDLLRFGVARSDQGQGVGHYFFHRLCCVAAAKQHDTLRILVSATNLPAVALYRKTGATYRGDAQAYAILWHCFELDLSRMP